MLGSLSGRDTELVGLQLQKLNNLTGTYADVGCDVPALGQAMDCLLDRAGSADRKQLALSCMNDAGLARAE